MIFFFLCIVAPTLVFSLNNTNITNDGNLKLVLRNTTNEENNTTQLQNTNNTTQEPQNTTTIITTASTEKKLVPQNNNKTGQIMKWVPLENQKKSENPNKKKKIEKPKHPRVKKDKTKVEKPKPVKPIKQDLPDMPLKSDLDEILSALHKMIDFFLENKNDVDISLYYGLFLMDVNLNYVFKVKHRQLPSAVTFSLKHLLEKNDDLLNFFKRMVDMDFNPEDELGKNLASLFSNEHLWVDRMQPFDGTHMNDTLTIDYDVLKSRYSFWDKYLFNVRDFDQAEPRPDQSDRCLGFLAKNPVHKTPWKIRCQIPDGCRIPLERGTNFGYGLTHRLIYLQLAYYGHRCYIFSSKKDKEMRDNFCKSLYSEASYISMNEYVAIDLFVEQLCLCALDGHYEFLRRSWLMGILSFQTVTGCFSDAMPEGATSQHQSTSQSWRLDRGQNQYILDGQCNIHTSSAAAATLGFGVKFILEAFY